MLRQSKETRPSSVPGGKTYERVEGRLRTFIEAQPVFFTATAPLSADGTVSLSPKGLRGFFVVLDELTVAYLDFTGSTAETIAHLRENGRGETVFRDDPRFPEPLARFPDVGPTVHGLRAIVVVTAEPLRDTCGHAVPFMAYAAERDLHARRFAREDDASLDAYSSKKKYVATRLDGLLGLPLPLPPSPA
ncbi:pyridoxamine 5'-phosphate oxidase family protein [Streptomyces sp. GDS52]|uniref:pyridoxamine 5'-phosphate oxidase family protein n=1 Tax=Streptomyces sp. GDS52 TaxID=3406419 RepID=UPI003FD124D0